MKLFIIGKSLATRVFADYSVDKNDEVFTTVKANEAQFVNIDCGNVESLKDFALENQINLTVVTSEESIEADIVRIFNENNLTISAPDFDCAGILVSKVYAKKFMYRNKIPTPKFGIFDKIQGALDYARAQKYPVMVKPEFHEYPSFVPRFCPTFAKAKRAIENLFESGHKNIVIEDYVEGREFSLYVVTDGFNAIPLEFISTYKNKYAALGASFLNGDERQKITTSFVNPTIKALAQKGCPYTGILGLDFIRDTRGKISLLEYNSFFKDLDCEIFMAALIDNISDILEASITGSLTDKFSQIQIANMNFLTALKNGACTTVYGRVLNEAKEKLLSEGDFKEIEKWLV